MFDSVRSLLFSLALAVLSVAALGKTAHATGTFDARGQAPGGDNSVTVSVSTSGAGALTVVTVVVADKTLVLNEDYTVSDNGSSTPDVVFLPGHVPGAGDKVKVTGTTAGGSGAYTGTLTW